MNGTAVTTNDKVETDSFIQSPKNLKKLRIFYNVLPNR